MECAFVGLRGQMGGRKLRLEFPGACYHVINRGNYRRDIFETEGAKAAFEECLFAACEKSAWLLHAYVVMRNHYHLAVETPQGNLVTGMQWLQATFANRFNRYRGENGHLFQGRYKALVVEEGEALGMVCHYIHLNPVRARVLPVERLGDYRYSSSWYLTRPAARAVWMRMDCLLAEAGGLGDTPGGWASYLDYLKWQAAEGPLAKSTAYAAMSRGWVLGGQEFKETLVKDHAVAATARAWEDKGAREIREQAWEALVVWALRALNRAESELKEGHKSAPWKVAVAAFMKERSQASNPWLARRLRFGRAKYVSRLVAAKPRDEAVAALLEQLRGKWAT